MIFNKSVLIAVLSASVLNQQAFARDAHSHDKEAENKHLRQQAKPEPKKPIAKKPLPKAIKPAPKEKKPIHFDSVSLEQAKAASAETQDGFERIVGGQAISNNQFPYYGKSRQARLGEILLFPHSSLVLISIIQPPFRLPVTFNTVERL